MASRRPISAWTRALLVLLALVWCWQPALQARESCPARSGVGGHCCCSPSASDAASAARGSCCSKKSPAPKPAAPRRCPCQLAPAAPSLPPAQELDPLASLHGGARWIELSAAASSAVLIARLDAIEVSPGADPPGTLARIWKAGRAERVLVLNVVALC